MSSLTSASSSGAGTAKGATHTANIPPHQTAWHYANRSWEGTRDRTAPPFDVAQGRLISALMRNCAGSFSVERLIDFLTALGQDVEITVRPTRKSQGVVSVVA